MTRLLFDPALLLPMGNDGEYLRDFWAQLVCWVDDGRVHLGPACQGHVYDYYARFGYPHQALPMQPDEMRREYTRALTTLLSRVFAARPGNAVATRKFDPPYAGTHDCAVALGEDVAATSAFGLRGIATSSGSWLDVSHVECRPTPPATLPLCREPGGKLDSERADELRAYFEERRVHIIGGREDARLVVAIKEELGCSEVTWLPSEKNKPPRNISRAWGGLVSGRDITVCITGRIGHAASGKAEVEARRRGVAHLKVETVNEVYDGLVAHCMSAQGSIGS